MLNKAMLKQKIMGEFWFDFITALYLFDIYLIFRLHVCLLLKLVNLVPHFI